MTEMFSGGGVDAAAAAAAAAALESTEDINLRDAIALNESYGRNVSPSFPISNLFIGDSTLGCKSDSDEQLIIHIAFKEFVKLKTIKITEFNNGIDPECNPTRVSIYVNRENVGFEDVEDIDPTQVFELNDDNLKSSAEPLALKYVKYQRVTSLTLFFDENNGADITALGSIQLFGKTVLQMNMQNYKAKPDQQM